MTKRGRPSLLTPSTSDAIVCALELGFNLRTAAERAGVGERTLRRWIEHGREEVDALSEQARLVLDVDRLMRRRQSLDWTVAAARLEGNGAPWSSK